ALRHRRHAAPAPPGGWRAGLRAEVRHRGTVPPAQSGSAQAGHRRRPRAPLVSRRPTTEGTDRQEARLVSRSGNIPFEAPTPASVTATSEASRSVARGQRPRKQKPVPSGTDWVADAEVAGATPNGSAYGIRTRGLRLERAVS